MEVNLEMPFSLLDTVLIAVAKHGEASYGEKGCSFMVG